MHLVIGLGNPGQRYQQHRHNIGFQIVDLLATRHGMQFGKSQLQARVATGMIRDRKVILAKPQTFMNNSGQAARALTNFYKIPPEQVIVIFDDLDLPIGRIRLRPEGGSGGQNGMKSIIQHLGTNAFPRLRVGIGRPPGQMDAAAYVLQRFSREQEKEMAVVREEAADAIEMWLVEDITEVMNRYN